jgi:heterotetrameric sarcosine oxidase alpha subunit
MSASRLTTGGHIQRDRSVSFSWDDRNYSGFEGDTLASALMANGEKIFGRSFKYHRPRGIMSAGVEESGAIVTIGEGARRDPNVKATMQELYDGLTANGQNAWPSVRFDLGATSNLFSRFFAAGFYYKTFMGLPPFEWGRGTGIWMQYEKIIRRSAGMGNLSREPDPESYEHNHAYCDLLVVGAGIAGISAALAAADAGLDVILVEQDFELGGDLLHRSDESTIKTRVELMSSLNSSSVRVMKRTTAFGLYDTGVAGLLERVTDHLSAPNRHLPRQRFWTVRPNHTVLAMGALERHFAFGDNDRPGIMSASAARAYVNRYAVLPGQSLVVSTTNDSAYESAFDLQKAGAQVRLLDTRLNPPEALTARARDCGIEVLAATAPMKAKGAKGITGIELAVRSGDEWVKGPSMSCDGLMVSGGWSPVVNLQSHRGVKPVWQSKDQCFLPGLSNEVLAVIGSAAGHWNMDDCKTSGLAAGEAAAVAAGASRQARKKPARYCYDHAIDPVYEVRVDGQPLKSFIDPQHDVTASDVRLAHQEGFVSVEHLKRYTTLGMATDQGKMSNVLGLALMADALGREISTVGTTTFRPPYTPISLGALAGRSVGQHFKPIRRSPLHNWNLEKGAKMTDASLWHRSWYFSRGSETINDAYIREADTVRKTVGMCDVTSLGKIAVQGPDATEFLNRVYTNPFAKLPLGKARYGIMLRDDGMVMDDGTSWRLSENEYFMTTTTTNAGKVMVWLEELLQVRWTDLKVQVTSVTDQWAGLAVAGPLSREVIQSCLNDPEALSNEACPFMGVIETELKSGIRCRIARISFSGEMAYELYVGSDYGVHAADVVSIEVGARNGCVYGLEALGALRIEKGHVTGAELDGRVTIEDAGLGGMAATNKSYIGNALRKRPELSRNDRPQLVGIFPKNRSETFNAGTILCTEDNISGFGEGWITAVTYSPALGHWIGLGFISGGYQNWKEQTVAAADPLHDTNTQVEIVSPHMYDPSGERMHG